MQSLNALDTFENIDTRTGRSLGGSLDAAWGRLLHGAGLNLLGLYARRLRVDLARRAPLPAGPRIWAANHPTTIDPFLLLTYTGEPISILVNHGAFQVGRFGDLLRREGHIPVEPRNGRAALERAVHCVRAGRSVGIFVEGSLSPLSERGLSVGAPRTGCARLALRTGAPVLPVGIALDWRRIRFFGMLLDDEPTIGRLVLSGPYAVTVGEPLSFAGSADDPARVRAVAAEINARIETLSRESALRVWAARRAPAAAGRRPATGPLSYGPGVG